MPDPFNLKRFVIAQELVIDGVYAELKAGRKQSHWMWFVFPQLAGLGNSQMAAKYAIASLAEAQAYLEHPILGPRLHECTDLVLQVPDRTIRQILGSPDDLKLRSCMTLFAKATTDNAIFRAALSKYYPSGEDPLTTQLLHAQEPHTP
jgi:uncharacterized protein (DUF1810 family)